MGVTRKAKGAEPKGQRKDDKSSNPDSLAAAGSRLQSRKAENPKTRTCLVPFYSFDS